MLIDLHCHTKAISHCCRISAEDNILLAKSKGFDGMAITNHYTSDYFEPGGFEEWLEKYIAEWNICRELGKKHGMKIFCGVEVTMAVDPRLHMLIYGCDEAFLRNNPHLYDKRLYELHDLCAENGCALVQAHPFRSGMEIKPARVLDGIEVNCHPLYRDSHYEEILEFAKNNRLAVTVGCDFHNDTYRPLGGTVLPDSIETDRDLADYILNAKSFALKIHNPVNGEILSTVFER